MTSNFRVGRGSKITPKIGHEGIKDCRTRIGESTMTKKLLTTFMVVLKFGKPYCN